MTPSPIDLILENQTLKNEFSIRNLDLSQVWRASPDNPELENRQLHHLLDWVGQYQACPDRKQLEARGYQFPPIDFCIDPDSDWYRFERWMRGLPIRKKLKDQLPPYLKIKPSEAIPEAEIEAALAELTAAFEQINYDIALIQRVPPRLIYEHLLEILDEEHEMLGMPGWCFDGCRGTCPDCFQRPWCEQGCQSCWRDDEAAGCMVFPEPVQRYVSPSPMSLVILQERQAEEERKFAEFKAQSQGKIELEPLPDFGEGEEWEEDDEDEGLPF